MVVVQFLQSGRFSSIVFCLLVVGVFFQLSGLLFNNDGSRYAAQLYLLLFLPGLVYLLCERFCLDVWRQFPALIVIALVLWVVAWAVFHPGSDSNTAQRVKVALMLIVYLTVVARIVRRDIGRFTMIIVASLATAAVCAWLTLYYQFLVLDHPLTYQYFRFIRLHELGWNGFANLNHPIVAGLYYSAFFIIGCWLFLRFQMSAWTGFLLIVAGGGLAFYILLTFSRGAWFALGSGGLVLLLLFNSRKSWSLLIFGAFLLVVGACLFWPEIQNERQIGVNGRDQIWSHWFSLLPEFWLAGRGASADLPFTLAGGSSVIHAHSLYLQLWYEYGIGGPLLFIGLLLSLLWKAWQCREQPLARLGAALLVFAMVAMVSDIYAIFHRPSPYWVVFWLPVGILLGVQKPERVAAFD